MARGTAHGNNYRLQDYKNPFAFCKRALHKSTSAVECCHRNKNLTRREFQLKLHAFAAAVNRITSYLRFATPICEICELAITQIRNSCCRHALTRVQSTFTSDFHLSQNSLRQNEGQEWTFPLSKSTLHCSQLPSTEILRRIYVLFFLHDSQNEGEGVGGTRESVASCRRRH